MSSYSIVPTAFALESKTINNQKIMEKERKITAPEGCEKIPYINELLDKIEYALLEFIEENQDDERTQTFGIDIHISVDD